MARPPRTPSSRVARAPARAAASDTAGERQARYSIRVTSRLTAIELGTLRMWERRYGFPRPERTDGGSRVYSESDVEALKLITRALEQGYRPGEIVGKPREELLKLVAVASHVPSRSGGSTPTVATLLAALGGDELALLRAQLRQAALTLGPKRFLVEVAHPLCLRIGELWADGKLEVRHEHMVSECLFSQLRVLASAYEDRPGAPRVLLATLPNERHGLGLAMAETYLAASQVTPILLGVDTPAEQIVKAARWFGEAEAPLSFYCQGLNQSVHGTDNNAAIIHLHLATGKIGKPGCGPFSLTGQPNAMGGREVGGLANLMSAHRDLASPKDRAEVAALWGIPWVPAKPGKTAVELFQGLKSGEIKAVWIACTNPAQSMPNQAEVREALRAAEFVVLQEAFGDTDTAAYADLLLPATTWAEKEGTVTNSERRISRVRAVVPPPGEARHDWRIAVDFAHRLGERLGHDGVSRLFPYDNPESIFAEHRESTRGRDLDITGLSYALLESAGPQQWPYPEGAAAGRQRLYTDGVFATADGRARFLPVRHRSTADIPDGRLPISLLTGRLRDQWHGMSRTGTVARLYNQEERPLLAMHPCDMRHRGLESGDIVRVHNDRGEILVEVEERAGLAKGRAWMPMHWGSRFLSSPGANALMPSSYDPVSFQPELKHAAVQIEKADLPYPLAVIRRCADRADALALLDRVRVLLPAFPFATVGLYGHSSALVVFRAATTWPLPEAGSLAEIDRLCGLDGEEGAIVFSDPRRGIAKKAIAEGGRLVAVRLAGETLAMAWLKDAMAEDDLDPSLIRFALAPTAKPPMAVAPREVICKCADVTATQIKAACGAGSTLVQLQDTLKCGTYCGSCLPDVKRLVAETAQGEPQAA